MADISKIKLPDGNTYDVKDASKSSATNWVNGSQDGSVRMVNSTAESSSYTIGTNAVAEGISTKASGTYSHAEGGGTTASSSGAHAEGSGTTASGGYSHAEGGGTTATAMGAHAEGASTTASGDNAHSEGYLTIANGNNSHAEGGETIASGAFSHAEGCGSQATGTFSHASGYYTIAQRKSQTTIGEYNYADTTGTTTKKGSYVFIIGNGTGSNARSNALTVDWSGNEVLAGKLTVGVAGTNSLDVATIGQLPTKVSDLTNDSGFITGYTETDPTVPSWAKASSKPTYTASEVGALPSSTTYVSTITTTAGAHSAISKKSGAVSFNVPTTAAHVGIKFGYTTSGNNRAVLQDSSGNLYVTQKDDNTTYSSKAAASGGTDVSLVTTGEKYTWNSKTSNTGTITSVKTTAGAHSTINITSGAANFNVPTKTSHLTNDSGFITSSALNNYLPLTGGQVTGPTTFGDSVSIDDLNAGQLVVSGSASIANNLQVNTINGIEVGSNPKFTDTTYSSLSAASGGTAVSLVTTGEKYTWNSKTSNTGTITSVKTTAGTHTAINTTSGAVSFNVPTKTSHLTNDSGYVTSSGVTSITLKAGSGISLDTDNTAITTTGTRTISHADTSSQASSSNSGRTYIQSITLDTYGHVTGISTAKESVVNTDTKLQVAVVTSGTQYYPIVGTETSARTRQYDTTGFKYKGTKGTTSAIGSAILELGNSTASGTANNKQAQLIMYGSNAKKATITLAAPSADVAVALPTSSGTLALTSQIPSISVTRKITTGTNIADVTVNGTTTQLFAPNGGGGDHEDLTQAEYDALTETEKTNGTVYFITDSDPAPSSLLNFFYPVGSYYETSDTTFDPNVSMGGIWELETEGLVHIGSGRNYTVGDTGGEATHILTVEEMPSHTHGINFPTQNGDAWGIYGGGGAGGWGLGIAGANNNWGRQSNQNTGGGHAHNNMPPYIVVNRWHRTA